MTLILASGFGTFMLFVALGLGALAVTAALDKLLGKEVALLVYAGALLLLTLGVLKASADDPGLARPRADTLLGNLLGGHAVERELLARPSFGAAAASASGDQGAEETRRNGFARFSDTRPLPPITLDVPPELALEFPLPPPIPGPAPAARRLLRGSVPTLYEDDASTPVELPPIRFAEYQSTPEDVFDWIEVAGVRTYVAIVALNGKRPNDPAFPALKRRLLVGDELDSLEVEWANIGSETSAKKVLDPASAARVSKQNRTTEKASQRKDTLWRFRRSVANEYEEQLAQVLLGDTLETTQNARGLLQAAEHMERLGKLGKEGREGWRRAALLLERALAVATKTLGADRQAEILVRLAAAYRALNDEQQVLRALTAYAKTAPESPDPAVWMGDLVLGTLGLPEDALTWFAKARAIQSGNEAAALGSGDALTQLGRHREALAAYERGGNEFEAHVRRAEAALRLGDLVKAKSASDAALLQRGEAPRALLVRGAILYVQGDLAGARAAFAMAAVSTSEDGLWRAQALYDLGLTCWRLGETRAAVAAFEGCDQALRMGSQPGRLGDETVSPSLGRALVAYTLRPRPSAEPVAAPPEGEPVAGPAATAPTVRRDALGEYLAAARDEAGQSSYREHFAGILASGQGNVTAAIRSLRRSLKLAPDATELDAWLAQSHLRWAFSRAARPDVGTGDAGTSRDPEERALDALLAQPAAAHFEAAVAFAARASASDALDPAAYQRLTGEEYQRLRLEGRGDPAQPRTALQGYEAYLGKAARLIDVNRTAALLREVWVRLQAEHLSPRRRFEEAETAADRVLAKSELREQPAALAMRAFARYRLGGDPTDLGPDNNYNKCQADLEMVLEKVPDKEGVPWREWRTYAERIRDRIKHWRSLEEKIISFEGLSTLTRDWQTVLKGSGLTVNVDKGMLVFAGAAAKDGTVIEPLVVAMNGSYFERQTFESLSLRLRIPTTDEAGRGTNSVTFGVGIQAPTTATGDKAGGVQPRHPGLSIFYDKAKVAARVGTGLLTDWKTGEVKRVLDETNAERAWPSSDWVEVRFVREEAKERGGDRKLSVYLGNEEFPVLSDLVAGFRAAGKAELWIGGWAAMPQRFEVYVKDVRIVRQRK